MTIQHPASSTQYHLVPELGPALGRLTALPGARVGAPPAPRVELADLRLALVGRIFELAAAARAALDGDGAAEILSPAHLRQEWERSAALVAKRTVERIAAALSAGAQRSGVPARILKRHLPTPEEGALIKARLMGAGVPFVDGAAALDAAEAGSDGWRVSLLAAARQLESSWLTLEQRALLEEDAWVADAARLAAWRPSPWPRRSVAGTLLVVSLYIGLVLGGYLPVPPGAGPIALWWWAR